MSGIALCKNAVEIDCPLRKTCQRFTGIPEKRKQEYITGDYYAGDCFRYLKAETDEERSDRLAAERYERYRDLQP
jgi:hypothetical protein